MNKYRELRERQQKEVNEFPMFFAFSQKQFEEGMKKFGLDPKDVDRICSLGHGGFCRKSYKGALYDMFERHLAELAKAIEDDETGEGFVFDMFDYELANHEYGYTQDAEPALDALGLTFSEVVQDQKLYKAFSMACKNQIDFFNENN